MSRPSEPGRTGTPRSTRIRYMIGMAVDATGNGMYLPVSLLFFHYVTGLPLVQVGLVMTVAALLAPLSSPVAGVLVDRFGPRAVVTGSYVVQAVGFACYPLAGNAVTMFVVVAVVAVGDGAFSPSIQSFIAEIAAGSDRDSMLATQRSLRNAGLGLGGLVTGAVLATSGVAAFDVIVWACAAGFLAAAALVRSIPVARVSRSRPSVAPGERGGYRLVFRDRVFLGLTVANVPTALGYSVLAVGIPVYVTQYLGTDPALVGPLYAVNTVGIALLQIPVTRMLARRGHRRSRVVAVGGAVFCLSFLSFAALGAVASGTVLLLGVFAATALFTVGELLHGTTASALVAGAAPAATRGRYMATYQLSWSLPTAVAPAVLTALLALSPLAMWLVLACGVAGSALAMLRLEPRLPVEAVYLDRKPDETAEPPAAREEPRRAAA